MEKPIECKGCPLEQKGISFSIPDGRGTRNIAIIGESLGDQESRDGLPFRPKAASGSKLEECFKLAGADLIESVSRSDFLLMNLIQCQPPANLLDGMPWENGAIDHCKVHFDSYISKLSTNSQRVILACGNLPLRNLTSASGIAKEKQSISHLRGYVFKGNYGYVVPCFHPSYLRRGKPNYTSLLVDDIKKAIAVANGEFVHRWHPDYKKPDYNENPSLEDAYSFLQMVKDNPNKILTYDIETENSAATEEDEREDDSTSITQIQFSLSRNTGLSFRFGGDFTTIIKELLQTANTKANHNTWNFDNKLLRDKGFQINGKIHDTMWMFKHYQPNLPRGLQSVACAAGFPFPWKHLYGSRLAYYGAADVDAVQYILGWLPPIMKKMGIWQGYYDHVFKLYSPTLLRASEKGIPVNETARLGLYTPSSVDDITGGVLPATGVFEDARKILDTELQGLIPDELRNIKPKRKSKVDGSIDFGYKGLPPKVKQLARQYDVFAKEFRETKGKEPISFDQLVFKKFGLQKAEFENRNSESRLFDDKPEIIERWCKLEPFKPSFDQVARYIRWKKKTLENSDLKDERNLSKFYEIPKIPKVDKISGERVDKDTTGKKVLEDLFYETGDRVLEAVLELRSVSTTITNFIPGWKPAKDGSVHTEWGFTAASGQLNSRRPNILNCSKHSANGQRFRRIIEAPEGYTFVEFDKKSYHVATMGFEANSKNYIRFSQIDPHSIFASYLIPSDWGKPVDMRDDDNQIREYCDYIRKRCKTSEINYRQLAKPCIAEGQLVLTDQGLIPIEKVTINQKLWDGVEWVSHQGVICKGIKEVITYEGLTATPDHKVYCNSGVCMEFHEAKRQNQSLQKSGIGKQTIRTMVEFRDCTASKESKSTVCLYGVSRRALGRQMGSSKWSYRRMQKMQESLWNNQELWSNRKSFREEIRCSVSTLQQLYGSGIPSIWSERDRSKVQKSIRIYQLGKTKSTSRKLFRNRDRQNKQQWSLRTREFETFNKIRTESKQREYLNVDISGDSNKTKRISKSIRTKLDIETNKIWNEWRRDYKLCLENGSTQGKGVDESTKQINRTRVYDIVNAGPRHRFTVSDVLVANCVLGNQLGLGPRKLWMQNRRTIHGMKHAVELQAMLADVFPEIKRTQDAIKKKAHTYHYLKNPWGYVQWFWDVFQWKWNHKAGIWKQHNGSDAEKAIAFPVQSDAFGEIKWNLLEAERLGWNNEYNFINTIHDSVIYMPRIIDLHLCVREIYNLFSRSCNILVNQATGSEGLKVGVEVSIGKNWQSKDYFGENDNPSGMREIGTKELREGYGI